MYLTPKTLLKKCRMEKREILILQDKLDQIQLSLLPRAIQLNDINVQESGDADSLAYRSASHVDLENELRRQIETMKEHEAEAHRYVARLRNSRHRQMLELYYLSFWRDPKGGYHLYTWEAVAEELEISERWLWKQIPDAFRELKKLR